MRYVTVRALVDLPELPLGAEGTFVETTRIARMIEKGALALVDIVEPEWSEVPEPDAEPALALAPEPEPEVEVDVAEDDFDLGDDD